MSNPDTASDLIEGVEPEMTEDELVAAEQAANDAAKEQEEREAILDGLAKKITELFCKRADARSTKEEEWIKAEKLYNAPLINADTGSTPESFFASPQSTRRPEPNIVRTKCDTAISVSYNMQFAAGEKNWDIFPPANNLDQAVTAACRLMEKEMETQLDSCRYPMHARKSMEDRVILGTGILKGPVNTGRQKVKYVKEGDVWTTTIVTDYYPSVEHVSPWRFYPDLTVSRFDDSPDVIQLHTPTPIELSLYKDHPGFDGEMIRKILNPENGFTPEVYNTSLTRIKEDIWNRHPYLSKKKCYAMLEYHGPITYDELDKLGICPTYESPTAEYYGEVWVVAGKVVRLEIENIEGFSETPYAVSVWKRDPGSCFGFGHPLLLADAQQVLTQAYHMILDNASLSAIPQVAVYKKHIQPIDGNWNIKPGKVWYMTDSTKTVDQAIKFFSPPNNTGNILPVLDLARGFADEESATPQTATGINSPGLSESATGQMLLQTASTALLDFQSEEWDDSVTEKIIRRVYAWNMQYSSREEIKGDYTVDVKTSSEYKNKQMYVRDLERLSMEVSQNPAMQTLINVQELQRARLQLMKLPDAKIVYSPEESQQIAEQQAQNQQPDPKMLELELKAKELEMKQMELQLRAEQLKFEQTQAQQREQWDYEERMGSNQARYAEAQARVLESQANHQIELLKLAQKGEIEASKVVNSKEAVQMQTEAVLFQEGMRQQAKMRDQQQTAEELRLKASMGSGI